MRQQARSAAFQQGIAIDLSRRRSAPIDTLVRARENADWNGFDDLVPVFPHMKLRQIIRAHKPCEARERELMAQRAQGLRCVARAERLLDV